MAGPTDLQTVAEAILLACEQALDTVPLAGSDLLGAPDRSFVSPGPPPIECCPGGGQLTVHVDTVSDAPLAPGLKQGRLIAGKITHVAWIITITRCVIDTRKGQSLLEDPLIASEQQATAEQINADLWAIWNELYGLWRSGDLFTLCGEVFFEIARVLPEQGGCAGWTIIVRSSLDGYQAVPAS